MLNLIDKKILIYGFGISGQACFNFLNKQNLVKIYDDNIKINSFKKIKIIKKNLLEKTNFDYIVLSPGININNCFLKNFLLKNKKKIISEFDIFDNSFKNNIKIAVTGTNGKSTTCKLIFEILKSSKRDARLVGNIGRPILNEKKITKKTIFVIEASSYQIEHSKHFKPDIAVILNISPDHLERHKNLQNYLKIKSKLILNQNYNAISLINKNCKILIKYLKQQTIRSKLYKIDNNIDINLIKLIRNNYFKNEYNLENLKFAIEVTKFFKVKTQNILGVVNKFKPLKYRQEIIYNDKNFLVINDSKSTSFSSTVKLLKAYKNIYWILGGLNKKGDKIKLPKSAQNNIIGYITGKNKSFFEKKLKNQIKIKKFSSLKNILYQIIKDTKVIKSKSNIIFSPSAASFDEFKNFEDRGRHFNYLLKKTKFIKRLNEK